MPAAAEARCGARVWAAGPDKASRFFPRGSHGAVLIFGSTRTKRRSLAETRSRFAMIAALSRQAIAFGNLRHPELVSGSSLSCVEEAENWMLKQAQHDENS